MNQALEIKFLEQLGADTALQANMSKCKSPEEALEVVKKAGYNVTLNEFKESMTRLKNLLSQHNGELTESDLEMVAGGRESVGHIIRRVIRIAGTIGTVITCASAAA